MGDPLNDLRLAIQVKILQEHDEEALSYKIFDPQCVSRLAFWNTLANPAVNIRNYNPPATQNAGADISAMVERILEDRIGPLLFGSEGTEDEDLWSHLDDASDSDRAGFAQLVANFYERQDEAGNWRCMLTNHNGTGTSITGAHIWPYSETKTINKMTMAKYGFTRDDLRSPRNGLLLLKPLERAFDQKQICFLWNPMQRHLFCCLLKEDIGEKTIIDQIKFKHINNAVLHYPGHKQIPFLRALNLHARMAMEKAKRYNWFDDEVYELYKDFSAISEHEQTFEQHIKSRNYIKDDMIRGVIQSSGDEYKKPIKGQHRMFWDARSKSWAKGVVLYKNRDFRVKWDADGKRSWVDRWLTPHWDAQTRSIIKYGHPYQAGRK